MKSKLITGDAFVKALIDAGLLPDATVRVTIDASVGEAVTMSYEVIGDARLLDITKAIQATDDPEKAIAR